MKSSCYALFCIIALQLFFPMPLSSQQRLAKAKQAKIRIVIEPVFNKLPLVLGDKYYVDDEGDTIYIDAFKFYISNIRLEGPGFKQDINVAHLFDAADTGGSVFTVEGYPNREYKSISFTIGVDSVVNTSGANEGDLDPARGMYWTWNSGYIMAKLEGRSSVCPTMHHAFEYHIGGYMPPYNTAREVHNLSAQFTWAFEDNKKDIDKWNSKDHVATLWIQADAAAWFKGIDLSRTNSTVIPGRDAAMMADRYAKMFTARGIYVE